MTDTIQQRSAAPTEITTRSSFPGKALPRIEGTRSPLYSRIATSLVEEIATGRFGAGQKLPSEAEIGDLFAVSRITVRQALQLLRDRGLIESFPGRGTFVTEKADFGSWKISTLDDLVRMGLNIKTEILFWGVVNPPASVSRFLKSKRQVFLLKGVRSRDGLPLHYIECHMLRSLGDRVERDSLSDRTPIELLTHALKLPVARANEEVWADAAPDECARYLKVKTGSPLLMQRIDLFGEGEVPLQSVTCFWRSDQFRRRYELSKA